MIPGIQITVNKPPVEAPTSILLSFRTKSTQPSKHAFIENGYHGAFQIHYEDGELKIVVNGDIVLRARNLAIADAEPHLLSVAFHRGGRMVLYLDGSMVAQTICNFPKFTNVFTFGSTTKCDMFLLLTEEVTAVKQAAFYNNGDLLDPSLVFSNVLYTFNMRQKSSKKENMRADKYKTSFVY